LTAKSSKAHAARGKRDFPLPKIDATSATIQQTNATQFVISQGVAGGPEKPPRPRKLAATKNAHCAAVEIDAASNPQKMILSRADLGCLGGCHMNQPDNKNATGSRSAIRVKRVTSEMITFAPAKQKPRPEPGLLSSFRL